jgi:hypothetical protein
MCQPSQPRLMSREIAVLTRPGRTASATRPRPLPSYTGQIPAPDAALRGPGKAALRACAALATHFGKPSTGLTQDVDPTRANGVALPNDLAGDAFVRLRGS